MADQHSMSSVGFAGIGAMGLPMALRLHDAGYEVLCLDPAESRLREAERLGMATTGDVDYLASCDTVVVMVANAQQLESLLDSRLTDESSVVRTVVVCSTVGPHAMREIASRLAEHGKSTIDLAVTGGVGGAVAGSLTLFAAGDPRLIESLKPMLAVFGRVRNGGARPGDGQSVKLVNNLLTAVNLVTVAEALKFATASGLNRAEVLDLISDGGAASWMLHDRGPRMALAPEERGLNTFTTVFAKDTVLIDEVATESGADVPLLRIARRSFERALERGWAEKDDSCIVDLD
mgnify:CR=1 FL=1